MTRQVNDDSTHTRQQQRKLSGAHLLVTHPIWVGCWNKSYMGNSPDSHFPVKSLPTRDCILEGGHVFERLQYCTVTVQLWINLDLCQAGLGLSVQQWIKLNC